MSLLLRRRPLNSPGLLVDPEVTAWVARIIANSGTVSATTIDYVNTFVLALKAAGLRSRFLRFNPFAGDQFAACQTPLFLNETESISVFYGNTYDTNNGFVGGDYSETGANGGLQGNGVDYLDTGFNPSLISQLGLNTSGLIAYNRTASLINSTALIGATQIAGGLSRLMLLHTIGTFLYYINDNSGFGTDTTVAKELIDVHRISSGTKKSYINGVIHNTKVAGSTFKPNSDIFVFATSSDGLPGARTDALLNCYAITDGVANDTEAATISTLLNDFYTNLSRNEY